ncbi:MAG TPA: sigma-70 family RNA polymerase sigma factor, partial [Actinomycetota bacterium]|nr:sigma-70 family RNA polymerase sigma factor [Actinomycetota bacterium]
MDYYGRAMDDAPLVRAACGGDKQAFADIYDRYSNRIYSFLCTVVRSREDAADLLQDTFLTAAARLDQLRDPEKLRPWLYAIARHLAMKSLKRSGRQEPLDDDFELADPSAGPSEAAARTELAVLLQDAAEGLGTQDRVVLDLHMRQGLDGQELGEALGVTAGHAYVMLSRMRDQVERSLGALMVARQGSKDCRKLEALLKPWDGRFTATWRKRVARHVDGCDICGDLRKRILSPASMLGTIPLIAAPAYARQAVLEEVHLVGWDTDIPSGSGQAAYVQERWPDDNGGFPPPMAVRRRPSSAMVVAAAILVVLLLAVPTVAFMGSPPEEKVAVEQTAPQPSYPLVFNEEVLKTPEISPSPEPSVQPNVVPPAGSGSRVRNPVVSPQARPRPNPGPPAVPPVIGPPGTSVNPAPRPVPPPAPPGVPGGAGAPGSAGVPS